VKTQFDPVLLELMRGEAELPEGADKLLYEAIDAYRMGGEGFTFKDWCALAPTTQATFIEIGNKMRDQNAARIAYFVSQPMETIKTLFGEEAAMKFALQNSMEGAPK
jgi:hypothetical protein